MAHASPVTGSPTAATKPLQMIRTEVNLQSFHRWASSRRLMSQQGAFDPGYAMHCLLTEAFGDLAPRPFRFFTPRHNDQTHGVLLGYACANADSLREAIVAYADPLQYKALNPENLISKPMPLQWFRRHQLGFEVLVRPTIRSSRSTNVPGAERDVFLQAVEKHTGRGQVHRQEVYANWLMAQFKRHGGADLLKAELGSFQRIRVIRRRDSPPIEGPDAVMRGILMITDGSSFKQLVARGIGRHRAYGYGMLLLRPAHASLAA